MPTIIDVHPDNPQRRSLQLAIDKFKQDGIIALPSHTGYLFASHVDQAKTQLRMLQLRGLDKHHLLTLLCLKVAEVSQFANLGNQMFRTIKTNFDQPNTYLLPILPHVAKKTVNPKRKTVGVRFATHPILIELLSILQTPLFTCSVNAHDCEYPITTGYELFEDYGKQINVVIDGGHCPLQPSHVIDLVEA